MISFIQQVPEYITVQYVWPPPPPYWILATKKIIAKYILLR